MTAPAPSPVIRGWCPGAFRPMESGDGWIVRVSPPGGRLTGAQVAGLAEAALRLGNGWLDLTSRASLQVRGVTPDGHPALLDALAALGLLPPGGRDLPGIVVTPFWWEGDGTQALAAALTAALEAAALPLPGKFGFAIDRDGRLAATSADIRLTLTPAGITIHPDGGETGPTVTTAAQATDAAIALARDYLSRIAGLPKPPRMRALLPGRTVPGVSAERREAAAPPAPGRTAHGTLAALAFGQMRAETLAGLGPCRVTPWRMVLVEGAVPRDPALITDPADPLLRVVACPGAPACPQGQGATRDLARRLAPRIAPGGLLHVSGCAKGCAHPGAAPLALTARAGRWDLAPNARAGDTPARAGLTPAELEDHDALRL